MRFFKPKESYVLFPPQKSLQPISSKYGFDRGRPIDRYYIEQFLEKNKGVIHGKTLEIHDNAYTLKYGGDRVTQSDALDIDTNNKQANIYGDLKNLSNIADNTYDTLVITQTFGMIDDFEAAIRECHRILKPGGVMLATSSCIAPSYDVDHSYWRFSSSAFKFVFGKYFDQSKMTIESYGNVLSGQAFWVGLALEELTPEELNYNDPRFPMIVSIVAYKN